MKLEMEDDWASKSRKTLESKDKQVSINVRAREATGSDHLVNRSSHVKRTKTGGSGSHNALTKFKKVKQFEDFKIIVGVIIIDSEIPIDIRKKYYDLCCGQKMFLHDHVIEGLSCKFLGSMISETVNTVDAIRQSNIFTSGDRFICWDKTLSCFEGLGMSVGSLRTWLNKLMKLNSEMKETIESQREKKVRFKEMRTSLNKSEELMSSLGDEILGLEVKKEKLEVEFRELAGATKL